LKPTRAQVTLLGFGAALLFLAALAFVLRTAPRLILANPGLVIHSAPAVYLTALLAALALLGLAFLLTGWRRGAVGILASALLGLGLHHLAWRLQAGPEGLSLRGLTGTRAIALWDVTRVDTDAKALVLTVHSGGSLRIATDAFTPEQRAALERTVSRLVRDAQGAR
jgi:hypothetical protein